LLLIISYLWVFIAAIISNTRTLIPKFGKTIVQYADVNG